MISKLPDSYQNISLTTPELECMPITLFQLTMTEGAFPSSQRAIARMMIRNERELISPLVRLGLETMRGIGGINAYAAKCFFFKKYFLTAREFRKTTGFPKVAESIKLAQQPFRVREDGTGGANAMDL